MTEDIIARSVRSEVEKAVAVAVENAKRELDRRVPEIVAGLSIKLMERVSMTRLQNELCIHISLEDKRTPT
jgi:hypothetical protein